MKKSILMLAACAAFLLSGLGCTTAGVVPKTKMTWNPITGNFVLEAPKDVVLQNFQLTRTTNGVQITIGGYAARMNPEVISESVKGQVEMINAGANIASQAAATGAAVFFKSVTGGMPIPVPQAQPAAPPAVSPPAK